MAFVMLCAFHALCVRAHACLYMCARRSLFSHRPTLGQHHSINSRNNKGICLLAASELRRQRRRQFLLICCCWVLLSLSLLKSKWTSLVSLVCPSFGIHHSTFTRITYWIKCLRVLHGSPPLPLRLPAPSPSHTSAAYTLRYFMSAFKLLFIPFSIYRKLVTNYYSIQIKSKIEYFNYRFAVIRDADKQYTSWYT